MSKHQYTCPDVIHDRKVAKRKMYLQLGGLILTMGGLWTWGAIEERKLNKEAAEAATED